MLDRAGAMNWSKVKNPLITVAVLAFVFFFPRLVLRLLADHHPVPGQDSPWISYLYLYGLGLVTFLIGLRVILRARACQFGRGRDSFWFGVLLAGYLYFALLHAAWILAALWLPFKGGA